MRKLLFIVLTFFVNLVYGQQLNNTNTKFPNGLASGNGATNPTSGVTAGMLFFKTATGFQYYDGSAWQTVMTLAGTQTVTGIKTFTQAVTMPFIKTNVAIGSNHHILYNSSDQARAGFGLADADGVNTGANFYLYTYLDNTDPVTVFSTTRATGAISFGNQVAIPNISASGIAGTHFITNVTGVGGGLRTRTAAEVRSDIGAGTGSGTVTSFSAGNLSPLFTASVANATTTPALSFSISNAAASTIFGNNTGSSAAPSFFSPSASGSPVWSTVGNAGTTAGTNFVGTTDNIDLMFKTNNLQSALLNKRGEMTIYGRGLAADAGGGTNVFIAQRDSGEVRSIVQSYYAKTPNDIANGYGYFLMIKNNLIPGGGTHRPMIVGDLIGRIGAMAPRQSDGTYNGDGSLGIDFFADENWSATETGSRIGFRTTSINTNTTYFPLYLNNNVSYGSAVTLAGNLTIPYILRVIDEATPQNNLFTVSAAGVSTATTLVATTFNGNTITTGTGILTLGAGKTLTNSNTLTLTATDGSTLAIGAGGTLGSNAYTSTAYAPVASPTFTGTVTIPTPFTLGATSVTSTGTQLNYLAIATGTTGTANVVYSASPTVTGTQTITATTAAGSFSNAMTIRNSSNSTGTSVGITFAASASGSTGLISSYKENASAPGSGGLAGLSFQALNNSLVTSMYLSSTGVLKVLGTTMSVGAGFFTDVISLTFPTASGTLATLAGTENFTNKSFNSDAGSVPSVANTISYFSNTSTTTDIARIGIYAGATGFSVLDFGDTGSGTVGGVVYDHTNNKMTFTTNSVNDQMELSSAGVVTITQLGTGAVQSTAGVLSVVSDSRLKTVGKSYPNALAAVMKIPAPQYWNYNARSGMPVVARNVKQFGLLADKVYAVLGEEFAPTQKSGMHSLSDRAILSLTVQALQEANTKIDKLKKDNNLK